MKATKLPSGNWRVQAYIGKDSSGKKITKSFTGSDKKTVLRLAAEFEDMHRDTSVNASFGTASKAFLKSAEANLSPSTVRGYISLDKNLERRFSRFYASPCTTIVESDIEEIIRKLKDDSCSPKTITNYYFYISAVLRSKKIRINYSDDLPEKKRPKLHIPTSEEVKLILEKARNEDTELWICLSLAALAPLRASEISGLSINDIDFQANTIHVEHALVRGNGEHILKTPKTDSSDRVIKMPREIISAINEQGYVTHYTPNGIYQRFKRICRNVGIENVRLHDLRHYCASILHAKGYPDAYIQSRTGHSTAEVLRVIYTHALDDEKKIMEEKMVQDLEQLI